MASWCYCHRLVAAFRGLLEGLVRFCLVGRNCDVSGGTTYLLMLAEGLLGRGHAVVVAAGGGMVLPCFKSAGAEHLWMPPGPLGRVQLLRHLRRRPADALICSGRGRSLRLSVEVAALTGTPCVCVVQDHLTDGQTADDFRGVDALVAVEEPIHEQLLNRGVDEGRVALWARPVRMRELSAAPADSLKVLWMGRLSGNKAWSARALIEAVPELLAQFPAVRVAIIGEGSGAHRIRKLAVAANRALPVPVISLHAFTLDPLSQLETAGVVVGGGYTCLEALCNGRPGIGAGFGWFGPVTRERLSDGYRAHFGDRYCDPCDGARMAEGLLQVLTSLARGGPEDNVVPSSDWFQLDHTIASLAQRMETLVADLRA